MPLEAVDPGSGATAESAREPGLPGSEQPSRRSIASQPASFARSVGERVLARARALGAEVAQRVRSRLPRRAPAHPTPAQAKNVVMIDIDDAVISVSMAVKVSIPVAKNGPDQILAQFDSQAKQLSGTPQGWVQQQSGLLGSPSDLALGIGMTSVTLPFAVLAVKSGIEATQGALQTRRELNAKRHEAERTVAALRSEAAAPGGTARPADTLALDIEARSLQGLDQALRNNRYEHAIGACGAVSGGSMLANAVENIALQSVTLGAGHNAGFAAFIASFLPSAATAVGILGTLVMGPLFAALGIALAGLVVHQGRRTSQSLRADSKLIREAHLREAQHAKLGPVAPAHTAYVAFIDRKLGARQRFMNRLKRWGGGYLAGNCLIALAMVAKAVLGIAALAGIAAALATPVGLGLIVTVTIVSGIIMAVCSLRLVALRRKSIHQNAYRLQESPLLSRKLDALYAASCLASPTVPPAPGTQDALPEKTALRSRLYQFITTRDRTRQHLLQHAAQATGKFRAWLPRSGDDAAALPAPAPPPQRTTAMAAGFTLVKTWLHRLLLGEGLEAARLQALQAHARASDRLTVTGLALWLDGAADATPSNEPAQELRTRLLDMLYAQNAFLTAKLDRSRHLCALSLEHMSSKAQAVFAQLEHEQRADETLKQRIQTLLLSETPCALETLKQEFLVLQGLDEAAVRGLQDSALNQRLAQYLLSDMTQELTVTRGILFDMHREPFLIQPQPPAGDRE
jgi:hypothetical protein